MRASDWVGDEVYDLAATFRDRCVLGEGSLFRDATGVATAENVESLIAVVGEVDHGQGTFIKKLIAQVRDLDDASVEFCAAILAFQLLGEDDTGGDKKVEHVEALLALTTDPPQLAPEVMAGLHGGGVATYGIGKNRRDAYLRFLVRLIRRLKELDGPTLTEVMSDPWRFRDVVDAERTAANQMQANAVLHLFFPETFETVISGTHRTPLLAAFSAVPGIAGLPSDDHRIARIRERVAEQLGYEENFYNAPVVDVWLEETDDAFEAYTEWAVRLYRRADFDATERNYKLEVAEDLHRAAEALRSEGDWRPRLRKALSSKNNLTDWRLSDAFLSWVDTEPDAAAAALRALWDEDHGWDESLIRFAASLPSEVAGAVGGQLSLASVLYLGPYPRDTAPFRWTAYNRTVELLRRERVHPVDEEDERPHLVRVWEDWLGMLLELRVRMLAKGVEVRDMLDAQSIAWWIVSGGVPEDWDGATRTAFAHFRSGPEVVSPGGGDDAEQGTTLIMPPATAELADSLLLPRTWLQETLDLLEEKRQLIFYGPPGTGKTFVAQRLGEHLAAGGGSVRLVQFHPSYTYEDFFEGYRPVTTDGVLTYALRPGPLKRIVEDARRQSDRFHLLIVDEINRGNLPKIFGELYFLLEYRDREIELQYSAQRFSLPDNLLVIGTMNTADRSIALVDSALRRRFYFRGLLPTRPPVQDLLASWLARHGLDPAPAELLGALNDAIGDDEFSIGPSYFITRDRTAPNLEHVWEHALLPLLQEHFFGSRRDVAKEFGLDAIRGRLEAAAQADEVPGDEPAD